MVIAEVEVAAAFDRKYRNGDIDQALYQQLISKLRKEFPLFFLALRLTTDLISLAIDLTTHYPLRGYDSVQLGTAILANETLVKANQPPLTFISADVKLNQIAATEKLSVEDPNVH